MDQDDKDPSHLYPEPPDLKRVRDLRARLRTDKASTKASGTGPESRLIRKAGNTAKDIGTYTLIPSLMIAGPVVGYLLGHLVEHYFGGEPWGATGGMLLGMVAAFRQVYLLLKRQR